jgi:tetratricopeptide (TPR) repeat protein
MWLFITSAVVLGAGAVVGPRGSTPPPAAETCAQHTEARNRQGALVTCKAELEATHAVEAGVGYATALLRTGRCDDAKSVAASLWIAKPGVFERVAGDCFAQERRYPEADESFRRALRLHRSSSDWAELARSVISYSTSLADREQYDLALEVLQECQIAAALAGRRDLWVNCEFTVGGIYRELGDGTSGETRLLGIQGLIDVEHDRAQRLALLGDFKQEQDRSFSGSAGHEQAISYYELALETYRKLGAGHREISACLNIVYSKAELKRSSDLESCVRRAEALEMLDSFRDDIEQLRARVAWRSGDLDRAWEINGAAYRALSDASSANERIEIAAMQTRIALARAPQDLTGAEHWARRAIEDAESARDAQRTPMLKSWVLGTRRVGYELLFQILVRGGRLEEAIQLAARWQVALGRDARSSLRIDASASLTATAERARRELAAAPAPAPAVAERELIAVVRRIDALALLVADGQVWRVAALGGEIAADRIGPFPEIRELIDVVVSSPNHPEAATRLGARVLPPALFAAGADLDRVLHVMIDPSLMPFPTAALRWGGRLLVEHRALLHLPRFPERAVACAPAPPPAHALVIAAAQDDTPRTAALARLLAGRLGVAARTGAQATSAALLGWRAGGLVHLGLHGDARAAGGQVRLHDREVSASEVTRSQVRADLVVLAVCSAAKAGDPGGIGSLATGFLEAGAPRVVAASRPVTDSGATELLTSMYERGGATEPIRALAEAQAEVARRVEPSIDWAVYGVYATAACAPRPDRPPAARPAAEAQGPLSRR